jgi:hypothetical protein
MELRCASKLAALDAGHMGDYIFSLKARELIDDGDM